MAIQVRCPNGHVLQIKEKHAGKSGLCPHCHARIDVPAIRSSGPHVAGGASRPPLAGAEDQAGKDSRKSWYANDQEHTGSKLAGSSVVRHKKACPDCSQLVPYWFATCPHCNSAMSTLAKL